MPQHRTFAALRGDAPARANPTEEPIEDVLRRVFSGPDGQRVLEHMIAMAYAPSPVGAKDRALRQAEGARRFVADLQERAFSDDRTRRSPGHQRDG